MRLLQRRLYNQKGFTLLELLIVLIVTGIMMSVVAYAVLKFRQVIIVGNTAKELSLYLSQARRDAINTVVTPEGHPTTGYYMRISDNNYWFCSCDQALSCTCGTNPVKSKEYTSVEVINCGYSYIKFNYVTGEFVITNNPSDTSGGPASCEITVRIVSALMTTERKVLVDKESRTIKLKL